MAEPQPSLMVTDKAVKTRITRADGVDMAQNVRVKHQNVLMLYMMGYSPHRSIPAQVDPVTGETKREAKLSISEMTGYSATSILAIIRREDVQALKQQLLESYEIEFELLLPQVVDSIRRDLLSGDSARERSARTTWLRYMKKPKGQMDAGLGSGPAIGKVSAEQVVFNILQQGNGTTVLPGT